MGAKLEFEDMRYAMIIEQGERNYSAYYLTCPDVSRLARPSKN
jgi:hypothetical protein